MYHVVLWLTFGRQRIPEPQRKPRGATPLGSWKVDGVDEVHPGLSETVT